MGDNHQQKESPLVQLISFNKLLEHYEGQVNDKNPVLAVRAKQVLEAAEPYPILREGFKDAKILDEHEAVIKFILADSFPEALTNNEIKTASVPYDNLVFNSSERFKKIIKNAGDGFELEMRTMAEEMHYMMQATVILSFYYGFKLDFRRPLFYDIPDTNGVMRHYRILYNADFMEILPTDKAKELTKEDVDELLANSEDLALWKEKIPPASFIAKGFVICNLFDVTAEHSISEIKSTLIGNDKRGDENFMQSFQHTFRSLFGLKNIKVGFAGYDSHANSFLKIYGKGIESYILNEEEDLNCEKSLCAFAYRKLIKQSSFFAIADVDALYKKSNKLQPYKHLKEQGIKSAILAPISDDGKILGILELVSEKVSELNSINAQKLEDVMPFIVSAVKRSIEEERNLIDAIIQHECTTVHESVYWKFQEEAKRFMKNQTQNYQAAFNDIVFKDVYPLYGQIDIRESSKERNLAIQRDLMIQLSGIKKILTKAFKKLKLPIYEELMYRVQNHLDEIKEVLNSNSEQAIFDFVFEEINPVLKHLKRLDKGLEKMILKYESKIDMGTGSYYDHRRNYDESVTETNRHLATHLDKRQAQAQQMYPHYFERYKTDGVEHNLYIGDSITDDGSFDPIYLNNLRLWQLQVMVEMENKYYALKSELPIQLSVASLLLVYSTPMSIRFRMDEKRFDVDGTYNARYEVIKKRIDKSHIKGTRERLTQSGKLSIVYSQKKDELEYLRYIKFLKSKGYFSNNIEIVELEGLQGISGLKAIRVEILYKPDEAKEKTYTYDDLMEALEV